jgi:ABC-2 type transport system permease protein
VAERQPYALDPGRAYRAILGSRVRSQLAYRSSFGLDLLGSVGVGLLEAAEIYVIFHNVDVLGGLGVGPALLVFALANLSFALAGVVVGHLDELPTYLRSGTLDAMLLRPLPVLAQLVTSDVSLRRLGRAAVAVVVLVVALPLAVDRWSAGAAAMLVMAPFTGAMVFGSLFVAAAGAQFWLVEGSELTNAFTYGSSYVSAYPASVLHVAVRSFFTFVVPAAFTAYLPTLVITGQPGPPGLPAGLGWFTPLVAALAVAVGLAIWRAGLRHYSGAGG